MDDTQQKKFIYTTENYIPMQDMEKEMSTGGEHNIRHSIPVCAKDGKMKHNT